jgi:acyl-coenzyme A synthetase/AMP-(fatty) acid ligase
MTSVPIGKACDNTELFVVNEQNEIASEGEVGELYTRGSSLMKGYWGNPQKTQAVLVPYRVHSHLGEEIVFRTGDLVKQDADGNYIYVGRRDHTIKSRGYRIELGEIEQAIQNHPEVAEVAALAIADVEIGNRIKAVVVLKVGSQLKQSDLQSFCTQYLPKYMIPETIMFQANLPKTSTGKIDRISLSQSEIVSQDNV